jgi:predicted nucleic acid-binding protein
MGKKPFQPDLFRYVFDASALINIERSRKMVLLRKVKGAILIPERVAEEIMQPRTPLERFIRSCRGVVSSFRNVKEEHDYLLFCSQWVIDEGEASAMAIALNRRLPLVTDERQTKATGKAKQHGIHTLSSQQFIARMSRP